MLSNRSKQGFLIIFSSVAVAAGCTFSTAGMLPDDYYANGSESTPTTTTSLYRDAGTPDSGAALAETSAPCNDDVCPLGCNYSEHRCFNFQPTNITVDNFKRYLEQVDFDLVVPANTTAEIDTESGEFINGVTNIAPADSHFPDDLVLVGDKKIYMGIQEQPGGAPKLRVLALNRLILENGKDTELKIRGEYAIAFYVRGEVKIGGRIVLKGDDNKAGPGGRNGGNAPNKSGDFCFGGEGNNGVQSIGTADPGKDRGTSGGGGGGHRSTGGDGGDGYTNPNTPDATKGGGGKPVGNDAITPLVGGCGGGAGGSGEEQLIKADRTTESIMGLGGFGGGGGGAIQITSSHSIVIGKDLVNGLAGITAPGIGGGGGKVGGGGGGGGSGGAILLEAPQIIINPNSFLAANGGGGGAGALNLTNGNSSSIDGTDGLFSSDWFTAGGGTGGYSGGGGAAGGSLDHEHGLSVEQKEHKPNGGGGGGSAGRIRLNCKQLQNNSGIDNFSSPKASINLDLGTSSRW